MKSIMKCAHTEGKKHNCLFVDSVNKYIEESAKVADENAPGGNDEEWNRIYHAEMVKRTQHIRRIYGK